MLISIFNLNLESANTYTINQNNPISLTTGYVDNMSETWNVVSTVTDKPLIISYTIGTENNYDWLTINNVDNSGNVTSQLLKICGTKSGVVSTIAPNGRVQVVFTSDVSMCYASSPSLYSGINVTFSVNTNNIVDNTLQVTGNGYVNGNLGVGTISPREKIDVIGNGIITGKLGIGETNPQGILQVRGTYDNSWIYFNSNAGMNSTKYKPKVGNGLAFTWNYSGGDEESIINYSGSTNARLDFTSWDGTNLTTEMTLKKGSLGIGTITPINKFEVVGSNSTTLEAAGFYNTYTYGNSDKAETRINIGKIENNSRQPMGAIGAFPTSNSDSNNGNLVFYTRNSQNMVERVRISKDGNVLIGTTLPDPTNALLTVNGTIHAKEINVTVDIPADYVFKPSYKLMPLNEVEQFVKTNSHLPEIPSAAEITKNGLSVGEMQNKLLQKIEELTLYVIEQQKRIEQLENNQK